MTKCRVQDPGPFTIICRRNPDLIDSRKQNKNTLSDFVFTKPYRNSLSFGAHFFHFSPRFVPMSLESMDLGETKSEHTLKSFVHTRYTSHVQRYYVRDQVHPESHVYVLFVPIDAFQPGAQTFVEFKTDGHAVSYRTFQYLFWAHHKRRYGREAQTNGKDGKAFTRLYVTVVKDPADSEKVSQPVLIWCRS